MAKRCARFHGQDVYLKEGDATSSYFANQLRGYTVVLASLRALDQDICHDGCSLPTAVIKVIKGLGKLKSDIEGSNVPDEDKKVFLPWIDELLAQAQRLPQDTSQPCRKAAGECIIGVGCFASAAVNLMKEIAEQASNTKGEGGIR